MATYRSHLQGSRNQKGVQEFLPSVREFRTGILPVLNWWVMRNGLYMYHACDPANYLTFLPPAVIAISLVERFDNSFVFCFPYSKIST